MADDSRKTVTEYLARFTDVANLSKIVTDIGPGFLIALSLALLFNLLTGIPLLPFQHYTQIEKRIEKVKDSIKGISPLIREQRHKRIEWEAQGAGLAVSAPESRDKAALAKHEAEKKRLLEQLKNSIQEEADLKQRLTDDTARLASLRTELATAGSLKHNLELLEEHLLSLLFLSLIIGVIFSQAGGHTFYNGRYRVRFWSSQGQEHIPEKVKPFLTGKVSKPSGDDSTDWRPTDVSYFRARPIYTESRQKEYEDIIRNYYRYLEIAMNMVFPTTLLSLTLSMIFLERVLLPGPQPAYGIALIFVVVLGFGGAWQLYQGAYDYFWHYKVKTAHFLCGLWEELHPQAPPPAAPAGPAPPASSG